MLSSRADSYFDPVAVIYNVGLFVLQLSGHSATGGKSGQEPTYRQEISGVGSLGTRATGGREPPQRVLSAGNRTWILFKSSQYS